MPRRIAFRWLVASVIVALASPVASAIAQTAPEGYGGTSQAYARSIEQGLTDLEAYWSMVFAEAGVPYRSPDVVFFEGRTLSGCGENSGPFYCRIDETIYLSFDVLARMGALDTDYVRITIAAHEWGHHVQFLLAVPVEENNRYELQADCLAGAFTAHAQLLGRLDPGDVSEAAISSINAGDAVGSPQDQMGAHGISDDRLTVFMRGYDDGLAECELPLAIGSDAQNAPADSRPAALPNPPASAAETSTLPSQPASPLVISTVLPATLALPQGQNFRVHEEGTKSLDQIAAGLPNPSLATTTLRDLGWQENSYRIFAADNPPSDAVGWVELHTDRVATVDGAAALLPMLAEGRMETTGMQQVDLGLFSDQSIAMAGPAFNGNELTIFARRANLIVRVTGIAPRGDPTSDVIDTILLPLQPLADEPRLVSPEMWSLFPGADFIPSELILTEEHARSAGTIAAGFGDVAEAERRFQAWGWRESAARVYTGTSPGANPNRIEVVGFRFATDQAAIEALPYFLDARAAALNLSEVEAPSVGDESRAIAGPIDSGFETTLYVRFGSVLFRYSLLGSGSSTDDLQTFFR